MPRVRSPLLGFNHNIRHDGWLFHVQTEDSGIQNPHIFTHLFHEGVILATRKMLYDPEAHADVVKGLMQAQHKAVLKELKAGAYDEKIRITLGPPRLVPTTAQDALAPDQSDSTANLVFKPPTGAPPLTGTTTWVQKRPGGPGGKERPFSKSGAFPILTLPADLPPSSDPPPLQGRGTLPEVAPPPGPPRPKRPTQPPALSHDPLVVARPAILVGGPTAAEAPPRADSIFGQETISEKSLDEVIMAYLSEDLDKE